METPYCEKNCIQKAASMILGHRYDLLQDICDNQKTVSTKKLAKELERLREESKLDGIFLREVSKNLKPSA